jgi:uncharacterized protein (DUF2147 family)
MKACRGNLISRQFQGDRRGRGRVGRMSAALGACLLAAVLHAPAWSQSAAPASDKLPVMGRWLSHTGNVEVDIANCGAVICGKIVKVLANNSMAGPGAMKPADERPALGMTILDKFVASGSNEWKGEIYNREEAKTYDCYMSVDNSGQLILHPYVGLSMFGKDLVWKRVAADAADK